MSTRRLTAAGREGNGGFCFEIQSSSAFNWGGFILTTTGSPCPVAAGVGLFLGTTVCFFMIHGTKLAGSGLTRDIAEPGSFRGPSPRYRGHLATHEPGRHRD